jgi:hypothetical protein
MLGPGLRLEALQGLSHRGAQRFAFLFSALHDEPLAVLEERQREPERRPELAASRGCRFQALLDFVLLAAGSYTHLDQTSGGVELLVRPACDAFGRRVRRCQTRALGPSLAPERAGLCTAATVPCGFLWTGDTRFSLLAGRVWRGLWIAAPLTARTR